MFDQSDTELRYIELDKHETGFLLTVHYLISMNGNKYISIDEIIENTGINIYILTNLIASLLNSSCIEKKSENGKLLIRLSENGIRLLNGYRIPITIEKSEKWWLRDLNVGKKEERNFLLGRNYHTGV